jgi:hypothetical protein
MGKDSTRGGHVSKKSPNFDMLPQHVEGIDISIESKL